jgi:hypothetical protein
MGRLVKSQKNNRKLVEINLIHEKHTSSVELNLTLEEYIQLKESVSSVIEEMSSFVGKIKIPRFTFLKNIVAFDLVGIMVSNEWDEKD